MRDRRGNVREHILERFVITVQGLAGAIKCESISDGIMTKSASITTTSSLGNSSTINVVHMVGVALMP